MSDQLASLLLLREADVVRLCGLAAAAQALEMVRAGGVDEGRRTGTRLTAHVRDAGEVSAEVQLPWLDGGHDPGLPAFTWGCSCPRGYAAQSQARTATSGNLGCAHVAALMTEWVRHPASFREERAPAAAPTVPEVPSTRAGASATPSGPLAVARPAATLVATATLCDHLARLSPRALGTAQQRVLGATPDALMNDTDLRTALYEALTDPVLLGTVCASLDDAALLLLRGLMLSGGILTEAALAAIGERACMTPAAQVVARHALRARCLLFPIGEEGSPVGWTIPAEVLSQLDVGLGLRPCAVPALPAVQQLDAAMPLRALCLTATLMHHTFDQLRPRRARTEGAASYAKAAGDLPPPADDPTPQALEAWARAAEVEPGAAWFALRLVRTASERMGSQHPLLALDRLPAEEWPYALRLGVGAWLDAGDYDELTALQNAPWGLRVRCDPRHPAFSLAAVGAENAVARRRLVEMLTRMDSGVWYALDDLVALVWKLDPYLLRGRQRAFESPAWWIEDADSGRPLRPDREADWMRAEGHYIRALALGPLRWLGLVEIKTAGGAAVDVFRCTPWMAYLLDLRDDIPPDATHLAEGWGDAVRPASAAGLSVQPLALQPTGSAPLQAWATVAGVRGGRLMWQLSAERACANLDAQRSPDDLLAWLRRLDARDGTRAAPHAAALFDRWQRLYGASSLQREIVVVEAEDDATLHEALTAMPDLAAEAVVLAPGVAALPRCELERIGQAFATRGYLV